MNKNNIFILMSLLVIVMVASSCRQLRDVSGGNNVLPLPTTEAIVDIAMLVDSSIADVAVNSYVVGSRTIISWW
jgi:hypothetical protein